MKKEEKKDLSHNPVNDVIWVPIGKVRANDYNPNHVAPRELELLYISIKHDGYTQPIVTIYDEAEGMYIIIDGFHRYYVSKTYKDLLALNHGLVPVVVLEKDLNDRMASTIRHNRARGKHSVTGMATIVFEMLDQGWADDQVCEELGMEPEELLKLKHITGFAKLFEDIEYRKAWKTKNQLELEKKYKENKGVKNDG